MGLLVLSDTHSEKKRKLHTMTMVSTQVGVQVIYHVPEFWHTLRCFLHWAVSSLVFSIMLFMFSLSLIIFFLLVQQSTVVQSRSSVQLMRQNQMFSRGPLPSPTAWSPDQWHVAMFAEVFQHILGKIDYSATAILFRLESLHYTCKIRFDFPVGRKYTSGLGTSVCLLLCIWNCI